MPLESTPETAAAASENSWGTHFFYPRYPRLFNSYSKTPSSSFRYKTTVFHTPVVAEETGYLDAMNTFFQHIDIEYQ